MDKIIATLEAAVAAGTATECEAAYLAEIKARA